MKLPLSLCFLLLSLPALADPCKVHVILFTPSDVKPPSAYQPRIDQIVNYADAFFKRELKRHGHADTVSPFHRRPDGKVPVTLLRGTKPTADYKPVDVRMEVMNHFRGQNKLDGPRQVWWIFVYAGDPPKKFATYLGGFGPEIGGWAICNFDTTPGPINPTAPLGSDFLEKITLKGMLHELGHGFQLPHIGPLQKEGPGNTLMGPNHPNFKRVIPNPPDRVYLSPAEAALLSCHPAFRGRPDDRGPFAKFTVHDLKAAHDPRRNALVVTGRITGQRLPVYALTADESDARPGEYWTKTYVAKVSPEGTFEVLITEPAQSNGTLKTWFAFDDGAQTGNGKTRGRDSGLPHPYTYANRRWAFN